MTVLRVYFDHNATTPIRPEARAAMIEALDLVGNPSSPHAEGRAARAVLEAARRDVAALAAAAPEDVIFTSGGTEALNMILTPTLALADAGPVDILLAGAGEHAAVLLGHRFAPDRVETIPLTRAGQLDLAALETALGRHAGKRIMLAIQAANNETGVIQPVKDAAALVHGVGGFVVCDAVQAAGKIDCSLATFDADAMAISAHKFGGPKGIGALIFAPSRHHLRQGIVRGGGQERGLRSGTENLPGIAGFGAAARTAAQAWPASDPMTRRRDALQAIVLSELPGATIFGDAAPRLPNTLCFGAPRLDARVLMMNLDLGGVAVSTGSACSSGKVKPSHVLEAMGVEAGLAGSRIRISLGWTTRDEDVAIFKEALVKAVRTMHARMASAAV